MELLRGVSRRRPDDEQCVRRLECASRSDHAASSSRVLAILGAYQGRARAIRLAQATLGEPLKKKRRSQQHREVRLRTLVENASTAGRFDLEYLRQVAKNFTL